MKRITIILTLMITGTFWSCAQHSSEKSEPPVVKTAFEQKFPGATKTHWKMEKANEWEVEFQWNGGKYSALFSENGTWMETELAVKDRDLPDNIRQILNEHFTDYKIEDLEYVESAEGISYEMEVEQGDTDYQVTVTADGALTKKLEEDDDDHDDGDEANDTEDDDDGEDD